MKVLLSTDTSCLVDYQTLQKNGISVFPLNVIIDGKEYFDGVTINQDELKQAMLSGKNVTTSTPSYASILEYFDNLFDEGYDQIIHFTISSKLSSMYNLLKKVSIEYYLGKVTVIDSYSFSSVMLAKVFYALENIKSGMSVEEIINANEQMKDKSVVAFIPDNLTALKKGGRITPTIAALGNTIGLKPVITLKDGQLEKENIVRSMRYALSVKLKSVIAKYPKEEYDYTLVDFSGKKSRLDHITKVAKELVGDENLIRGVVPINICAHCGPGTIGILVTPKINGKSIKDYM